MRHYIINGFKKTKTAKKTKTIALVTTLTTEEIIMAMNKCRYIFTTIVDADSLGGLKGMKYDEKQYLTLFDELRIIKTIY